MAICGLVKTGLGRAAQSGKWVQISLRRCEGRTVRSRERHVASAPSETPPETRLTGNRHYASMSGQDEAEQRPPTQCSISCAALRLARAISVSHALQSCSFIFRTRAGWSRPSHSDLILRSTPPQPHIIASRHVESEHNKILDQDIALKPCR